MTIKLGEAVRRFSVAGSLGRSEPGQDEVGALHAKVREARLELARRNPRWVELVETDLVRRGPSFLVHVPTDAVYTVRRGHVFEPDKAVVGYVPDGVPLAYYVDASREITFLEAQPRTWSELVERKARRGRLSVAP